MHVLPPKFVGSTNKPICPNFIKTLKLCLRSRKFAGPASQINCKDQWINFCNRFCGGRPVTVPGGAPPPVKNLRPPLKWQLHSFLLCFQAQANICGLPWNEAKYNCISLKTLHQHLLTQNLLFDSFRDKESRISGSPSQKNGWPQPGACFKLQGSSSMHGRSYPVPFHDKGGRIMVVPVE